MKRINVLALRIIPEMVFDQHLHSDLSVWHGSIINDQARASAKAKLAFGHSSVVFALISFVQK
jgi:hypothetical protein